MSFSGRLHKFALRGFVAAFLVLPLAAAGECLAQDNPANEQNYSKRQPSGAGRDGAIKKDRPLPDVIFITPVIIPEQNKPDPGPYQPDCNQPKNAEDGNFCQQRRAAKAGEDAARAGEDAAVIAKDQLNLSYWGFGGLVLTVIFTGWAAVAAARAAKAAQKSADSLPNIERAYVFFWDVERRDFSFTPTPGRTVVIPTSGQNVIYRNCGKTPAVIVKTKLGCDVFAQPPNPADAPEKTLPSGAVIGASDDWPRGKVDVSKEKIERAKSEGAAVYLYGEITYRDIFKNEQRSWFCRRWTGDQFVLGDLTDEKLNGYT
jgi:hypothetical protein